MALSLLAVLLFCCIANAAVTCTSSISNKSIGLEYVSTECHTNTTAQRVYIVTSLLYGAGHVDLFAHYGDSLQYPGSLVNSLLNQGYRVFGDQYGNHIIAVHSYYGSSPVDTIDGKQMSAYPVSNFHSNVFDKILYPQSVDIDADNDHYTKCNDRDDTDLLYHDNCPPSHCVNSVQGGDEAGVDCGGSCPETCPAPCEEERLNLEKKCGSAADILFWNDSTCIGMCRGKNLGGNCDG